MPLRLRSGCAAAVGRRESLAGSADALSIPEDHAFSGLPSTNFFAYRQARSGDRQIGLATSLSGTPQTLPTLLHPILASMGQPW
jgi:hypothetical protein